MSGDDDRSHIRFRVQASEAGEEEVQHRRGQGVEDGRTVELEHGDAAVTLELDQVARRRRFPTAVPVCLHRCHVVVTSGEAGSAASS
jgi:hypothetical protein